MILEVATLDVVPGEEAAFEEVEHYGESLKHD